MLVEDRLVLGVGPQEHDQVGLGGGVGDRQHPQPGGLGLGHRRRALAQADAHVDARVLQVEGVGVALRAVADDGDLAAGDEGAVGVLLVVHVGHQSSLPSWRSAPVRCQGWAVHRPSGARAVALSILGRATRPVRWQLDDAVGPQQLLEVVELVGVARRARR